MNPLQLNRNNIVSLINKNSFEGTLERNMSKNMLPIIANTRNSTDTTTKSAVSNNKAQLVSLLNRK